MTSAVGEVSERNRMPRIVKHKVKIYDIPEDMFLVEIGFEIPVGGSHDIEEGKDASDIEENNSHSKVSSGADPVMKKPCGKFQQGQGCN